MMRWGQAFRMEIFGASHAPTVGVRLFGPLPAVTAADFEADLTRRRAGAAGTTSRHETDMPVIKRTKERLEISFENADIRPSDYGDPLHFRPSHADFTAYRKYGCLQTGGGIHSGRMTVALVAAGVVAKKLLPDFQFTTTVSTGDIPTALKEGDSVGGVVECRVSNVPTGLGEPFFDSAESLIAGLLFSIGGVKGVEFGDGFATADRRGSVNNDLILDARGTTATNHDGGINGGITNGNELVVRAAFKPTPSIARPQMTYNAATDRIEELTIKGRHDACIALRGAVVVEAAVAIALAELTLRK